MGAFTNRKSGKKKMDFCFDLFFRIFLYWFLTGSFDCLLFYCTKIPSMFSPTRVLMRIITPCIISIDPAAITIEGIISWHNSFG